MFLPSTIITILVLLSQHRQMANRQHIIYMFLLGDINYYQLSSGCIHCFVSSGLIYCYFSSKVQTKTFSIDPRTKKDC